MFVLKHGKICKKNFYIAHSNTLKKLKTYRNQDLKRKIRFFNCEVFDTQDFGPYLM